MNDFKSWATRRLRDHAYAGMNQSVWTEHGSTPYLWTERQLLGAIDYVKYWQGGPLQRTWEDICREIDEKEKERCA